MVKKTAADVSVPEEKPTFEAFCDAVKHVLAQGHDAPALVASALIKMEENYLRRALAEDWDSEGSSLVMDVAAEIALGKPANEPRWVMVEQNRVLLEVSDHMGSYLDAIAELGLHGEDRHEVGRAMLARGIESMIPLLAASKVQVIRKR